MVGYLFLWDMDTSVPWLGVAVRDGYKGMGLGKRLMRFARDYAGAQGKDGIVLTTVQDSFEVRRYMKKAFTNT